MMQHISSMDITPALIIFAFIFISLTRAHLLLILMVVETITLILSLTILISLALHTTQFFLFALLAFSACEASIGLAILTALSRSQGTDFLSPTQLTLC